MDCRYLLFAALLTSVSCPATLAQVAPNRAFEESLLAEPVSKLVTDARRAGDPVRGAIITHGAALGCVKCHAAGESLNESLGPNLAKLDPATTDEYLVDSVLRPSKEIRKGYEGITVLTLAGQTYAGIRVSTEQDSVTIRTVDGKEMRFADDDIDSAVPSKVSIMPAGQVSTLQNRQQFLDLLSYLFAIRDGGMERAKQLQPSAAQLALKLPEYESRVDHAGILRDLDDRAIKRGKAVYDGLCINCHGTLEQAGSLPTALRFGEGKFKRGSDPLSMYTTLTHGFGLMLPQPWMVPSQKHDVIHYIRETFLRKHNPSQYSNLTDSYLAGLPKGDTRGPAPQKFEPWVTADYGPYLVNTYEFGSDMKNIAQKGIAVQLDSLGGGVSRGRNWIVFDHDTMRVAGAWTGKGFIDWRGIHFNGNHGVHPRIVGDVIFSNPDGPGWANPATGKFEDDQRIVGRDGRRFGPLPHSWATYHGMYRHGRRVVVSYSVGETQVLESFDGLETSDAAARQAPLVARTFNVGPRSQPLSMVVATVDDGNLELQEERQLAIVKRTSGNAPSSSPGAAEGRWDGSRFGQLDDDDDFDMQQDFTVTATIATRGGGTIFAKTDGNQAKWVPGGRTFFVRGGKLGFDIGWSGVVMSKQSVNDGKPRHVAVTWQSDSGTATLYINGEASGRAVLKRQDAPADTVARIGFTSENFPTPDNGFSGQLTDVRFFQRVLSPDETKTPQEAGQKNLLAHWPITSSIEQKLDDASGRRHDMIIRRIGAVHQPAEMAGVVAGLSQPISGAEWFFDGAKLCLRLPEGTDRLQFAVWTTSLTSDYGSLLNQDSIAAYLAADFDLGKYREGGDSLWPQEVKTTANREPDSSGLGVDRLSPPRNNPWLARTRLTGFDFFDDPDRMAVCSWDGDVWQVTGLAGLDRSPQTELTWRRIASGLFQPLGLKIVDGKIFVNCRDQIVILNDLNGDGETDYYQCFNDDHQVTEHFHEFAMGLQRDAEGNFYYAKSARHAKTAIVPHHGTLLRVSPDGSTTDILATGFRAANGVCLNPDGSFIVTDQEGHWNPKNRINWVKPGGFYGNMYGYHTVTDASDDAMEQPLCWITNAFDRSPAELLWVDSDRWGPLQGKLLNLSYGYGKVYVVPHEIIDGQPQGGMCELPLQQFPTGLIRGRFSPHDGQLYVCGMFAWASSQQTEEGGFYRIRYAGGEMHVPLDLQARQGALTIRMSDPVDPAFASDPANYRVTVWSLQRTANYGSKHFDEHELDVRQASVDEGGTSILLKIPNLEPTWCMEIKLRIRQSDKRIVERVIHNTIHQLPVDTQHSD